MFDLKIEFSDVTTRVAIGTGVLREVGGLLDAVIGHSHGTRALVVTDEHVGPLYSDALLESLGTLGLRARCHTIAPGEGSKSLKVAEEVYRALTEHELGRDGIIVALGGGVVSDLAGFVAATWMRGVRFVVCPTTLEADIDASIGGKTAVNLPGVKNLIGAFHQPVLVAIDLACLCSLEPRDVRAGLAESVKHALICSEEFLSWHEANVDPILAMDPQRLAELIRRNVEVKADVVARDPREESGLRMRLNLGHTIGHAVEACSAYSLRHGECVALGLLAACRLSQNMGLLDVATVERVERLLTRLGLPTRLPAAIPTERIIQTISKDKKAAAGNVQFVLLEGVGRPVVRRNVAGRLIVEAYESLAPSG